jgi:hypothetical protein
MPSERLRFVYSNAPCFDALHLSAKVSARLIARESGAAGSSAHVYFDTNEYEDGVKPVGTYSVSGTKICFVLRLQRGNTERATVSLRGRTDAIDELADKIVIEIEARLGEQ